MLLLGNGPLPGNCGSPSGIMGAGGILNMGASPFVAHCVRYPRPRGDRVRFSLM